MLTYVVTATRELFAMLVDAIREGDLGGHLASWWEDAYPFDQYFDQYNLPAPITLLCEVREEE